MLKKGVDEGAVKNAVGQDAGPGTDGLGKEKEKKRERKRERKRKRKRKGEREREGERSPATLLSAASLPASHSRTRFLAANALRRASSSFRSS